MGFDPVASAYCILERLTFGGALQRARTAHLSTFLCGGDVLLIGDGDGRFLEALLVAAAREGREIGSVVSVDASARMLALARERVAGLPGAGRVTFCHSEIQSFRLEGDFAPAVVGAHFVLDCFEEAELPDLIAGVGAQLPAGGALVVSDFGVPKGCVSALLARFALWGMVRFFRVFTGMSARRLPDLRKALKNAGWKRVPSAKGSWWDDFLFSDVWQKHP